MYASELRAAARRALTNRWPLAIVAGLLVRLLCGTNGSRPSINLTYSLGHGVQPSISLGNLPAPLQASLVSTAASLLAAALLMSLLYFTIGSVVQLGYARFNLSLIDGESLSFPISSPTSPGSGPPSAPVF